MAAPQFLEEKPLSLVDVKTAIELIEKRDTTLNFLANKTKEYLTTFVSLSEKRKEELHKKILGLNLTRIKEEQVCKIIDLLPKTVDELKVIILSYHLSLSKKDQDAIIAAVKEFT